MKNVIILTSILLLSGCTINSKLLSPAKSDDEKIIVEQKSTSNNIKKRSLKFGMFRLLQWE